MENNNRFGDADIDSAIDLEGPLFKVTFFSFVDSQFLVCFFRRSNGEGYVVGARKILT